MRESAVAWPQPAAGAAGLRVSHPVRPLQDHGPDADWDANRGAGAAVVSVELGGAPVPGGVRAGAAFLIDALHRVAEPGELARMIGCLAAFLAAAPGGEAEVATEVAAEVAAEVAVAVGAARERAGAARLRRPVFEVERTAFGAAHILHETAALGLYVLELAPGAAIPAHYHRVMEEAELALDRGLLLQGRPVRRGDAFVWPAGRVHAYANPGAAPRRVLCIDRPKFIPEDEVPAAGPVDLAPARPARRYRV